ncbi:hypothetical protein HID58_000013, partial [Brassica napus]
TALLAYSNTDVTAFFFPFPLPTTLIKVLLPTSITPHSILTTNLTYITEEGDDHHSSTSPFPLFSLAPTLPALNDMKAFLSLSNLSVMKVDKDFVNKCKFVVATGIFDAYDQPHQPSNISQEPLLFPSGGQWVGIWRLILLKTPPYDEPRLGGTAKSPKS